MPCFSLAETEGQMSIKNGRSPALRVFYCFDKGTACSTLQSRRQLGSSRVMSGLLLEPIWCRTQNRRWKQCITEDLTWCIYDVWLKLIVHTWNSSPLRSNLLRLQCTCGTVPTTFGRPRGSSLVWVCQWPSLRPLSSPQLFHNESLWA